MPHGKAARKRNWKQATKAKASARKAEKRAATSPAMEPQLRPLTIPTITEVITGQLLSHMVSTNHGKDDLLSFQFSHFGDNTKPDTFFVDPEEALNYCPEFADLDDDGLGWYDDGVKRTLTDEQIEMFRHTEIEQLMRKRRLEADEQMEGDDDDDDDYEPPEPAEFGASNAYGSVPHSPVSDASSLEAELLSSATIKRPTQPRPQPHPKKKNSQNSRGETARPKAAASPRSRKRKYEVPYDQRNKRKWESYIDDTDPVHGSMTHRRMVRELDGQQHQSVAIDYGDDEPAPPKPAPLPTMPGRRIISYEDD